MWVGMRNMYHIEAVFSLIQFIQKTKEATSPSMFQYLIQWAQMLSTNDSVAVGISISLTTKIYVAGWKEGLELGNLQFYHMKQWSKPMDNKDEVPEFLSWKITFKDKQQNTNRYKSDQMKFQLQESAVGLMSASFPWKLTRIFVV